MLNVEESLPAVQLSCSTDLTTYACSPEPPPFSPITPQQSVLSAHNSLSTTLHVTETPLVSTMQNCTPAQQVQHLDTFVAIHSPLAASSPKGSQQWKWSGFKIVIDNIDMNVRPRHQTFERQTKSVHYVNSYAVRDRIDLSTCSTEAEGAHNVVCMESLLPTEQDRSDIMANFVVLAGRILSDVIPALRGIPNLKTQHITHLYSQEMSTQSEIVRKLNIT